MDFRIFVLIHQKKNQMFDLLGLDILCGVVLLKIVLLKFIWEKKKFQQADPKQIFFYNLRIAILD